MHLAYCIAFLCLLRVDEVLNIQFHELEIVDVLIGQDGEKTVKMLKVTLPFRKTNQFGYIQPFYLRPMLENQQYLCAYWAYAEWVKCCQETDGFVFWRVSKADHISKTNKPLTSQKFLEAFCQNLLDINVDPALYGMHSFRRGGTQWLHFYR
ncbi:DNA breaking-rejoining enzyme [Moniliophthora roreri MCA 2997]|uniref:DNA breaking-rejoining enzyme n=1 Tax=Moniliophthora roreri (strain MCA 2997) TaxID=1381753 RepID=V2WLQ8_MONRO|nr:DNA breaking-rejoining enzyme [Moniliophthora roreri MCA 2997]